MPAFSEVDGLPVSYPRTCFKKERVAIKPFAENAFGYIVTIDSYSWDATPGSPFWREIWLRFRLILRMDSGKNTKAYYLRKAVKPL
jgi:hypothetical protein